MINIYGNSKWGQQMSRQAAIDKAMCKPGYTWNETLQRCLPAYVGPDRATQERIDAINARTAKPPKNNVPEMQPEAPISEQAPPQQAAKAIAAEVSKRRMGK